MSEERSGMELDFQKDPTILGRVMDAMSAGFFTVDADGYFVAWSDGAERITGYARTEIVGNPCTLLEGQNCKGFATLKDMLDNPDPCAIDGVCSQECKLLSKDGRTSRVSRATATAPERNPYGSLRCRTSFWTNVRSATWRATRDTWRHFHFAKTTLQDWLPQLEARERSKVRRRRFLIQPG
ncbi:MAG: PAS domain-containing protein [Planctomycetota bacterium]|nr:PAS domain-containing protein [Planctomycetota bacterium]